MVDIKEERHKTLQRVEFSNNHQDNFRPDKLLREEFLKKLGSRISSDLIKSPILDSKKVVEMLLSTPSVNKIHSTSLDYIDSLPFRPDLAFDSMWRSLEAIMVRYALDVWHLDIRTESVAIIRRVCSEVLPPVLESDRHLADAFHALISIVPNSVCRYALSRMLLDREIKLSSQFGFVSDRIKESLGQRLHDLYISRYLNSGKISPQDHYSGSRKIERMLRKEPLKFFDNDEKGLDDQSIYKFIISGILYTSRCERAHGDYFSPFVSVYAKMDTYRHWYWILTMTHALYWIVFRKYCLNKDLENVTTGNIANSISSNVNNFTEVFK